jgi:V/A-type H+-transporting ATPase subunit I
MLMAEDLPEASLALAETEYFHPDARPPTEPDLHTQPGRNYREVHRQAWSRLEKIVKVIDLEEKINENQFQPTPIRFDELAALNETLGQFWNEASRFEESLHSISERERLIREQEAALENFANLKIDLGSLRNKTRFLEFYVGLVPRENLARLEGAVKLANHLLFTYLQRDNHTHVIIVGPPDADKKQSLAPVLASAGFQALAIPEGFDNQSPEQKRAELERQRQALQSEHANTQKIVHDWRCQYGEQLIAARYQLLCAEPFVTLDPAIHGKGSFALLAGWVPVKSVSQIEEQLSNRLTRPFALETRDPNPDEDSLVPTVPTHHPWLAPFATLVKQYGVPSYGEIDPTPLFAATFLLMFGMMFGDIGHGAVIALAAWLARKKLKHFAYFGIAAGCSSVFFGIVFGSIFGYEDVLPALWMAPLHDPILMLKVALVWGIGFIILACVLGIYNRIVSGRIQQALLAPHGAVNLLFYLGFLSGAFNLATTSTFGTGSAVVVIGSLLTLSVNQWQHLSGPTGEKVLIVVIETLDTVIVYLSNTLSFLRVSAFSMNHAALALAIFTLADMLGTFGTMLTLLLGNLFILVLEGGIVMIQVMRLQYYEGFSRYFSGDGHEFAPLRLRRSL